MVFFTLAVAIIYECTSFSVRLHKNAEQFLPEESEKCSSMPVPCVSGRCIQGNSCTCGKKKGKKKQTKTKKTHLYGKGKVKIITIQAVAAA